MQPTTSPGDRRLYFLDWVRILAFFVLIAYHVGMYYVSWGWHVKSPHAGTGPEPFMLLSSPWRLCLLFFVAGAASHFLLRKMAPGAFVRRRSLRLLLPLLFGMLVIVPPQPWLEVVEKLGHADGFMAFMRLYLVGYGGFCQDGCLILPTWNHLWFVAYLWVYTLVLAACTALLGNARVAALAARTAAALGGWKLIVLPALFMAIVRILLADRFPSTHALVDDWFNHATYLPMFLLGALVASSRPVWERMESARWTALGIALAGWAAIVAWHAAPHHEHGAQMMAIWVPIMRCVYTLCAWSAIVAACGFARRHLDRDGPARRYLTDAVFPVYIAHQTLIVVMAHAFKPLNLAPGVEALLLMVLTATGSFALYEAVRRLPWARPLFGLAPRARTAGGPAPAHGQALAPR
jgi:surface polysaccharide O-acyltransferase-like enzyme